MGTTFGKGDSSATNDLDAGGNIVATGTGVKTVADPNQGLTDDQMKNRKMATFGAKSLGTALSPSGSPQASPAANPPTTFSFANNQPAYQPPQPQPTQKMKNPFFGY
jgi:hypothetical protein